MRLLQAGRDVFVNKREYEKEIYLPSDRDMNSLVVFGRQSRAYLWVSILPGLLVQRPHRAELMQSWELVRERDWTGKTLLYHTTCP